MKLTIQRKHILSGVSTILVFGLIYLTTLVDEKLVHKVVENIGYWGLLFIALVILATQIFAPLTGTIGLFVGYKIYGYGITLIVFYFVSMLSAIINFHIANKYGRKYVIKLVGKSNMEIVDKVALSETNGILIGLRIFGYFFFDFISYAIGLTKINFRKYMIYTAVFTPIPILIQYLAFKNFDFNSPSHITIYYVSLFLSSLVATRILYKIYLKQKKVKSESNVE